MKILLSFAVICAFVFNSFGSPLVFKVTKEIKAEDGNEFVELAVFDASKYKQIRVGIRDESAVESILNVFATEDDQPMLINQLKGGFLPASLTIDSPPAKMRFMIRGQGNYHLFIWATQ